MSATALSRSQPMPLECRPDLIESTIRSQGDTLLVVKDPIALKYFNLKETEWFLLKLLDGKRSLSEICNRLQSRFPAVSVDENQVHSAIQGFHRQGLLVAHATGQGAVFKKRKWDHTKKKFAQLFSSILAIRFPGVNPTWFLDTTYPLVKWAFHPVTVFLFSTFLLAAAATIIGNIEAFYGSLPQVSTFFAVKNLPFLALTIFVTKTVHELGHAYVCKHFGAACHSIGFMLLVLSPAAYCDTSDSWMLPEKRKRILIAAAGMFFELLLAAGATFVWRFTEPNWLHFFCLNLIIVSSVTTILFNANPLLRYDGYYILSDLVEIPNLAQRSRRALLSWLRQLALGMPEIKGEIVPQRQRLLFVTYAIASFFYRWFILFVIYWFVITFFESNEVAVVGYLLAAVSLGWTLFQPAKQLVKFFKVPGRMRQIKKPRLLASLALILLVAGFICLIPLDRQVTAPFVVQPAKFKSLFVETPGVLKQVHLRPGDSVDQGDIIVELVNHEFQLEVTELESQIVQLESEIDRYKSSTQNSSSDALAFSANVSELQKLRLQLAQKKGLLAKLQVRAPASGTVYPALDVSEDQQEIPDPFETSTLNAYLESETPVCIVSENDSRQAIAFFDQNSIRKIEIDQPVSLLLDEYLDQPIAGKVVSISRKNAAQIPRPLSRNYGGEIGTGVGLNALSPISPLYRVDVEFRADQDLRIGMRGLAKLTIEQRTLAGMFADTLLRFIRFR